MNKPKRLLRVVESQSAYWVGDGFPVRNLFPSNPLGADISPFLMLDYAGPHEFAPSDKARGGGEHPHRGFETVSIAYQGSVGHRDSAGNAGVIRPGDVQWMTAASGVVHEELHEADFVKRGGVLEMIQLWVNLPRSHKMSAPRYQSLTSANIPNAKLDEQGSEIRIIAGNWNDHPGGAQTVTPIELYDLRLKKGAHFDLKIPAAMNTALFLLKGAISIEGKSIEGEAKLALFSMTGESIMIGAQADSTILVLAGEPIDEPVAQMGPFVMNSRPELLQAVEDYRSGKMGHLTPTPR